jgi:hypothetical protein
MQTKFLINGTHVSVVQLSDDTALDYLPPKVYAVQFSQFSGFYLTVVKDRLQIPEKIYGTARGRVEKCITTYKDRPMSTGILLTGDKGTGKTLFTSLLANSVIDSLRLPVILVRDAHAGDQFDQFVQSLGECCLVFDEFGKMYTSSKHQDGTHQDSLLSLMDGVDKTKRLIIMTENSEMDISDFMLNRPSRIYYHFRYRKLDEASIKGYCADHGVSATTIKDIIDLSRRSKIFSFDMLQSIVEEHLRFEAPVDEIIDELNIDVRQQIGSEIEIIKVVEKGTEEKRELAQKAIVAKPSSSYDYTYIKLKPTGGQVANTTKVRASVAEVAGVDADEDDNEEIYIASTQVVYESAGQIVYETNNHLVMAKEVPAKSYSYRDMF